MQYSSKYCLSLIFVDMLSIGGWGAGGGGKLLPIHPLK